MALPALRQPKTMESEAAKKTEMHYVIVTLKNDKKLVVSSDAYHGILTAGEMYRCVFCEMEMVRDIACKERHKQSSNHKKILEIHPHMEDFSDNLIRQMRIKDAAPGTYSAKTTTSLCRFSTQLQTTWMRSRGAAMSTHSLRSLNGSASQLLPREVTAEKYYCTICNVIVLSQFMARHLSSEVHAVESQKAMSRAEAYKPYC